MADANAPGGHAFISYVREDAARVDELQALMEDAGVPIWRDTDVLLPGEDWRTVIRQAVTAGPMVFLACFSRESASRNKSFQNEELLLAVEQLRLRQPGEPWLIPVRFDDCQIPDFEIGAGRTLASIQRADLFGSHRDEEAARLVASVQRILGRHPRRRTGGGRGDSLPERQLDVQDVESLHPREVVRRIRQTDCSAVARVLAAASTAASAEVLDVLLEEDKELTFQILEVMRPARASELIGSMTLPRKLAEAEGEHQRRVYVAADASYHSAALVRRRTLSLFRRAENAAQARLAEGVGDDVDEKQSPGAPDTNGAEREQGTR